METPLTGPRATAIEIANWVTRLREWSSLLDFGAVVDEMDIKLGDRSIDQPGVPFRDAYVALRCARAVQAGSVRLGDDPPDFQLRVTESTLSFETVEVLRPGRRRGDELNEDRLLAHEERIRVRHIPDNERLPVSTAIDVISRAIIVKASKGYPDSTILVAYINLGFSQSQRKLEAQMANTVSVGFPAFAEIWTLADGKVARFLP